VGLGSHEEIWRTGGRCAIVLGNGAFVGSAMSFHAQKQAKGYRMLDGYCGSCFILAFRAATQTTSRYPGMDINCPTICHDRQVEQPVEACNLYQSNSRVESYFDIAGATGCPISKRALPQLFVPVLYDFQASISRRFIIYLASENN
jgi:hypothetical protein